MDTPATTDAPTIRHDGWTPERRTRFLDSLSHKGNVRLACSRAGMSPEAAYRLKRRDPLFARGWAAALVLAHDNGIQLLHDRAIDGIEEEVWYGGELRTRRKHDSRLFLAHLARLDKAAEDAGAQADAGRFDELLACIGGEKVPDDLLGDDGALPVDRETAGEEAARDAEYALRAEHEDRGAEISEREEAEGRCLRQSS